MSGQIFINFHIACKAIIKFSNLNFLLNILTKYININVFFLHLFTVDSTIMIDYKKPAQLKSHLNSSLFPLKPEQGIVVIAPQSLQQVSA